MHGLITLVSFWINPKSGGGGGQHSVLVSLSYSSWGGQRSSWQTFLCVMLQGSILSPLLLNIYMKLLYEVAYHQDVDDILTAWVIQVWSLWRLWGPGYGKAGFSSIQARLKGCRFWGLLVLGSSQTIWVCYLGKFLDSLFLLKELWPLHNFRLCVSYVHSWTGASAHGHSGTCDLRRDNCNVLYTGLPLKESLFCQTTCSLEYQFSWPMRLDWPCPYRPFIKLFVPEHRDLAWDRAYIGLS